MFVRVRSDFTYREELRDVKLKHIRIKRNPLEILIPKLKTDQRSEGHVVSIPKIKSECCPFKYFEVHLQMAKVAISNDNESLLICRYSKQNQVIKYQRQRRFHIPELRKFFDYISEIMTTSKKFGLHSFRPGRESCAS